MKDNEAMTAVNKTLDRFFRGEITEFTAIHRIARISGQNAVDHDSRRKEAPK